MTVRKFNNGKPLPLLVDIPSGGRNWPYRHKQLRGGFLGALLMCVFWGWVTPFLYKEGR